MQTGVYHALQSPERLLLTTGIRIGEISLMKDLTHTMDISMKEAEEEEKAAQAAQAAEASSKQATSPTNGTESVPNSVPPSYASGDSKTAGNTSRPSQDIPPTYTPGGANTSTFTGDQKTTSSSTSATSAANPYSQDRPRGLPMRPALMSAEDSARQDAAGITQPEKDLREKEKKKGGLTREQREELAAYETERKRVRDERVQTLARRLVDRISVWTETDKGADVTRAFKEKTRLEIENLKMESFGLEIMHAIGATYLQKAGGLLKSQKFLGISGFWSRIKDKGTLAKETWGTISTAIDAQMTMEEMAKMEEKGGEEWTDEARAEYEKRVTGKILAAAWRGSKYEIQSVLRDVCDVVLEDRKSKLEKRIERARAMVMMGEMLRDAQRDPDEEGE